MQDIFSINRTDHVFKQQPPVKLSQRIFEILIIFSMLVLCVLTFPFSFLMSVKLVRDFERIVILRLGRVLTKNHCGTVYLIPFIDKYFIVDLRLLTFQVPPQQVLTNDSVTISVDAIVFYRVSNAVISVVNIEDSHKSTQLLAQTTIRNMIGLHSMYEVLTDRQKIASSMQIVLDSMSYEWGIKVERVEIKDISLPVNLQKAMSLEAEATRLAKAKFLTAEGEKQASIPLRKAAQTMESSLASKQCITLRYLQTLNSISTDKSSTIIFPLPSYVLKLFSKKMLFKNGHQTIRSSSDDPTDKPDFVGPSI